MRISDFNKLPEKKPDSPKIGDIFLEGDRMVGQKGSKAKGQIITYYTVIKIIGDGSTIEYAPKYEPLEEDY